MRFRTTIELGSKTATGFEVPAEVVEGLGAGKRPSVTVTINSHTYRSTVAPRGGRFLLPLSAENRQGAGVSAGDEVEVEVALDTAPREVEVPADLAEALERAPEARKFFESLSYSRQRRYVLQIEGAKKPETRQRRVADTIARLADGIG
ncbi:YdeI/OmpD-associated family protein [Nonomuraea sp. NPDC049400]|uniref:YdeI/OmpD-associated family protein n=1 Tax=Nonomuraea sp. NPDC049400 TaxID=3364352 RepID=UPI0037AF1B66